MTISRITFNRKEMKPLILWFGLLLWLSFQTSLVPAERRVALVIGNANYPSISK
jgi:hypothetical protein